MVANPELLYPAVVISAAGMASPLPLYFANPVGYVDDFGSV